MLFPERRVWVEFRLVRPFLLYLLRHRILSTITIVVVESVIHVQEAEQDGLFFVGQIPALW